jgi:hypothetical protein
MGITEISTVLSLLPYIISAATSVIALVQYIRKGKIKEALNISDTTLDAIITAIELLPKTDATQKVKDQIKVVSELFKTEKIKLADAVEQIQGLVKSLNIQSGGDSGSILRAAAAVEAARKEREAKKVNPIAASLASLFLLIVPMLLLVGCIETRYTTETVWPGTPNEIVVEWPSGTVKDDVITVETGGRVQTVAPLTTPAPTPTPSK